MPAQMGDTTVTVGAGQVPETTTVVGAESADEQPERTP
jgi:hypothetical protein